MNFSLTFYPVILLVLTFVWVFLEDVCDQNDYECQHPNDITVMGHLENRKCHQSNILRRIRQTTLLTCVKECFITSQCTAINYRKNWSLCDVVGEITDSALVEEDGCSFSKISTWPNVSLYIVSYLSHLFFTFKHTKNCSFFVHDLLSMCSSILILANVYNCN